MKGIWGFFLIFLCGLAYLFSVYSNFKLNLECRSLEETIVILKERVKSKDVAIARLTSLKNIEEETAVYGYIYPFYKDSSTFLVSISHPISMDTDKKDERPR